MKKYYPYRLFALAVLFLLTLSSCNKDKEAEPTELPDSPIPAELVDGYWEQLLPEGGVSGARSLSSSNRFGTLDGRWLYFKADGLCTAEELSDSSRSGGFGGMVLTGMAYKIKRANTILLDAYGWDSYVFRLNPTRDTLYLIDKNCIYPDNPSDPLPYVRKKRQSRSSHTG